MSEVKERPILFSAPMVRAILECRKTVTRRVMKTQPEVTEEYLKSQGAWLDDLTLSQHVNGAWQAGFINDHCPYGQIGDRLWVRETWLPDPDADHDAWYGHTETYHSWSGCGSRIDGVPPALRNPEQCIYRADGEFGGLVWRPSIHMPRWASRILLEITDVRVERLQDITYEEAVAEGVHRDSGSRMWAASDEGGACHKYPVPAFRDLWSGINGTGSWAANPWVWCVSFRRVEQ